MNDDTVLLIRAAQHYLTNPDWLKEDLPVHANQKAGAQYVNAFRALFREIRGQNQSQYVSSVFKSFLDFEIVFYKVLKTYCQYFGCLHKRHVFFRWDQGERIDHLKRGNLVRRKRATNRMRTVFSEQLRTSVLAQHSGAKNQTTGPRNQLQVQI